MPKVFIATPVHWELVHRGYAMSVADTIGRLGRAGVGHDYAQLQGDDVATQRDELAALFEQTDCTHLFFLDSDMSCSGSLCLDLLKYGKELVAAVCTHRTHDKERVRAAIEGGHSFDGAWARGYKFNFRNSAPTTIENGLMRVDNIGAAVMLISRECFERVRKAGVSEYTGPTTRKTVTGYFQRLAQKNGSPLWEDWSFCERVRAAGGEVLAYVNADVKHMGDAAFGVPFSEVLKTQKPQPG